MTGRDGSQQPKMVAIDIWRLQDGKVGRSEGSRCCLRGLLGMHRCASLLLGQRKAVRLLRADQQHQKLCAAQHGLRQNDSHPARLRPSLVPALPMLPLPCLPPAQVVAAEQCWQLMRGPAGDDIEITAEEGRTAELVRTALSALQASAKGGCTCVTAGRSNAPCLPPCLGRQRAAHVGRVDGQASSAIQPLLRLVRR